MLQNIAKGWFRKAMLKEYRRSLMRPVQVLVQRCADLRNCTTHPFVHVMVLDREDLGKAQFWACSSQFGDGVTGPTFNDTLLLPGVSGNQMVTRVPREGCTGIHLICYRAPRAVICYCGL